jgi:3-oxoadipate enol-lactonase
MTDSVDGDGQGGARAKANDNANAKAETDAGAGSGAGTLSSAGDRGYTVSVNGEDFFVDDGGPAGAAAVLFSHSIMTTHGMWRGQLDVLRRAGYRAIAYDGRGHGASVCTPAPYTMRQLGDDVIALLDALHIERVHLVGLSLGGMIAYDLLARRPDRLISAVVCDARADAPPSFAAPWDERIGIARTQGMAALASPTIERWFGAAARPSDDVRRIHAMLCDTPVEGFVGTGRALQQFDVRGELAGVRMPVTLVCGENDGVLPEEMAALAKQIPGAVLELIPAAGHLPNVENPTAFDAALLRHFERTRTR